MRVCRIDLRPIKGWRAIAGLLAITFLFACSADAGQLTLAWTANTESDLAGYKLHYGTSSHTYQTSIDVGNRTTYIVTGLLSGQTYYFAVTAYNTSGAESGYSNETSGVVGGGGGLPAGLVAAYAFDEGAGTTTGDASGSGNTGTLSGATWNATGKFGKALSFNGSSSLVTVADAASLDLTNGMTLEAWLYPTALSGWRTAILKRTTSGLAYSLYAHNNVPQPATTINVGGSDVSATGPSALPLNSWSHLAATYDGTTMRIYVNGAQVGTFAVSGSITTSTGQLSIGGNNVWGEYFSGLIDEVRVYNRALSAAEIQTDMTTAIGGGSSSDTTPPTASITAPAAGAVLTGTTAVTATATDNVGVVGGPFKVDGANVGAEDMAAPYSISWDTSTASNGAQSLTAAARHAAGNVKTSAAVSVTVANATTGTIRLSPQDTTLNLDTMNYSADPSLMTYTWPANQVANAIVMKFDLTPIPTGATVQAATLHLSLTASDSQPEPTYTITAHRIINKNPAISSATGFTFNGVTGWTANTCCFNNVPLAQADIAAAVDSRAVDKTPGDKTWTVTSIVQQWWTTPTSNLGLLLNSDASALNDRYRYFASMENANATLRPYLEVTYSLPPGGTPMPAMMTAASVGSDSVDTTGNTLPADASATAPSVSLVDPLSQQTLAGTNLLTASASDIAGIAGVQFMLDGAALGNELRSAPYTLEWDTASVSDGGYVITAVARNTAGAIASSEPISVVVANGNLWISPLDTELGLDAINRSAEPTLSTTTWPDNQAASAIALQFNLAQVPAAAMVYEATLHMALLDADASAEPSYNVSAHKITGRNPVMSRATGYKADGTRPWAPTACCSNNVPLAQADISPAYDTQPVDTRPGDKVWSVTPIVQEWLGAPTSNRGLLLNPDLGARANRYRRFASSEHPNRNLRPYLQVRYTRLSAADVMPPAVALTAPAARRTVAGAIALAAAAGDNAAMAGVQFKVDGVPVGGETAVAPYTGIWDTRRVADGPHVIIAIARDAAGNLAVSEPVTVVVKNVVRLVR